MHRATLKIIHTSPIFPTLTIVQPDVLPLMEDLLEVDDMSNYVQHIFSGSRPLLSREEREICDRATD